MNSFEYLEDLIKVLVSIIWLVFALSFKDSILFWWISGTIIFIVFMLNALAGLVAAFLDIVDYHRQD